jgi:ribosomal protein L37AE/L43A
MVAPDAAWEQQTRCSGERPMQGGRVRDVDHCPACHGEDTRRYSTKSWLLAGVSILIVGLMFFWVIVPPIGPAFIVGGLGLMLASPFLPDVRRCPNCRKTSVASRQVSGR